MAKTKPWAVVLMIIITFLITIALLFYRYGVPLIPDLSGFIFTAIGLCIYSISAGLIIIAFKGGELSILYPLLALSYIWISIASPILFPTDSMNPMKWAGVIIMVFGIAAIGIGSKQ